MQESDQKRVDRVILAIQRVLETEQPTHGEKLLAFGSILATMAI